MNFMNLLKSLLKKCDLILVNIATVLVALYRLVSKVTRPKCRFYPTCSSYALQTFREKGFFTGLPKVLSRISRCHPFNEGGYDPVK
jgi:hypothetical protein